MYLNAFSEGLEPLDLAALDEFASLLQSAVDLGIPHAPDVRYRSRNTWTIAPVSRSSSASLMTSGGIR